MDNSVIPAITDPYSLGQAKTVSLQLGGLVARWESAGAWAAAENGEMRAALGECAGALEGGEEAGPGKREAAAIAAGIRSQLAHGYPLDPPRRSFESIAQEGQALGALMEQIILRLDKLQQAAPSDERLASGRLALRRVVRAQAERRDPKLDSSAIQHQN